VDSLTALQRRERIIAVVRWVALVFALAHVMLYIPTSASLAPAARAAQPVGFSLVAALVVVCVLVEVALRIVRTAGALRRAGTVLLLADVGIALGFAAAYGFDPVAAPWAVLTLLPLEGALRFGLQGALAAWALIAPGLLLADVTSATVTFSPGNSAYRVTLLLAVALFAGVTARDLQQQRRLLAGVAEGSRQLLGRMEPAEIFRVLCREVVDCVDARSAVVYVDDGSWFQAVASWPQSELVDVLARDAAEAEDPALPELVRTLPVWLDADEGRPLRLAVPLRPAGQVGSHVLVVRPARDRRLSAFATDAVASLAESAALALATTRLVSSEQRANRRLRTLEALRTRFVATVAHDLRLPLTVFRGVASMLRTRRDSISPERMDAMLASVERQANRLSRLADDLLDGARLDAERFVLHLSEVHVRDVIDAAVADSEEGVDVDCEGDLVVVGDGARLERVVWNLLSNAEKYGKPPFAIAARADGDHVEVAVRDHGSGLARAQRDRLFQDFAGSDDAASVGLGLAIVWELVAAHGGTVRYGDAEPGACFVVRLPVAGPPVEQSPAQ
jgi:K+-sensing histidine kinase KdpD